MKYGKDTPSNFIEGALTGGNGPSEGIKKESIGKGQTIMSAYPMDNVGDLAGPHLEDTMGGKMGGGVKDLSHSLTGASRASAPGGND